MASSQLGSTGTRKRGGTENEYIPKGMRVAQMQNYTPEAMDLYRQQFQHVGPDSYLARLAGGDQSMFDEMEAPAKRQFNGLVGNAASRFSRGGGEGSLSARKSSGFQNEMTAGMSNFAQDLQGRRQELRQNAIKDLMSMSHTLMNEKPFERSLYNKPQEEGFNWGGAAGGVVGGVGGFFAGGPMGAISGASAGYNIGSSLSGRGGSGGGGGGFQSTPGWQPSWNGQGGGGGGYNAMPGLEDQFRTGEAYSYSNGGSSVSSGSF